MKRILVGAVAATAIAVAGAANAQTVIKIQTANAAGSFSLKYLKDNWVPKLEAMTYGNLKIDIRPSKTVVPHRETPPAVAAGILQGDNNAVAYFAGRDPVLGILGDLLAGYDTPAQKQMFFRFGGGVEVLQKAWDKHLPGKIHVVGAGPFAKEAFVSTVPIFAPVIVGLGSDPIWFGVLFVMNIQIYFLSPPFGPACFWLKSVAPPDITLEEIFMAVLPFIGLQIIGLTLVIVFPKIVLVLPRLLGG